LPAIPVPITATCIQDLPNIVDQPSYVARQQKFQRLGPALRSDVFWDAEAGGSHEIFVRLPATFSRGIKVIAMK